jgi:hypothetical protein
MAFLTFDVISAAGILSTLAVSLILRTGAVDETPDVEEAFIYFFLRLIGCALPTFPGPCISLGLCNLGLD